MNVMTENEQTESSDNAPTWSLHYRQGYEEGYQTAVRDLLRSLLSLSEEFLANDPDSREDLRPIIYRFEEHLERRLWRMSEKDDCMEGGLGI
jgi:hypothetical protein